MLEFKCVTGYRPCTIRISVLAKRKTEVLLQVFDAKLPDTFYTARSREFEAGEHQYLYVQMPITGKSVVGQMDSADGDTSSFSILEVRVLPLSRQIDVVDFNDKNVRAFIPFAERFAFNASVLPTYRDRMYTNISENPIVRMWQKRTGVPEFNIRYMDVIKDEDGRPHLTPAQIGIEDQIINVSKEKFKPMTIPMRICILLHEFSHLFVNEDMYNEEEADLNGLKLYLGLGYPRIEAHNVFIDTFYQSQTNGNLERYEKVGMFINEFEKLNYES